MRPLVTAAEYAPGFTPGRSSVRVEIATVSPSRAFQGGTREGRLWRAGVGEGRYGVVSSSGSRVPYDGVSDRELLESGREGVLRARVLRRLLPEVQEVCGRLVGMGGCAAGCPDACPELNSVGVRLVEREYEESLGRSRFTEKGFLRVVIVDDDFRRLWNESRGIVPKVLNNKLLRGGVPTGYGTRFAAMMLEDDLLRQVAGDDASRLRVAESWLRNVWDDACDNAEMDIRSHPGGMEASYRHPARFLDDGVWSRYGFRVDRIHRRRCGGEHELSIDASLPEGMRPSGEGREALGRTRGVCEALLRTVERTDEVYESFDDAPGPLAELDDPGSRLEPLGISSRVDDGWLQVSSDDMDRFSDGTVDEKNPRTLFDDFYDAWYKSRRPDGHREISLETVIGEGIVVADVVADDDADDDAAQEDS